MEIQYIRKLTSSHMVVEQSVELSDWERQMIAHTSAEHLLFAECVRENEKTSLWYDITGKQSLDVMLETKALQYEGLCGLLLDLCRVVDVVESILLAPDGLLLLPECIFRDYRTQQMFFCYYPGNTQQLPEAFGQLLEYLLTRLDHGDERAVTLAYGIYERFAKGGEGLGALKELLCMPYERESSAEEPDRQESGSVEEPAEDGRGEEPPSDQMSDRRYEKRLSEGLSFGWPSEKKKKRQRKGLVIPSLIPVLEKYGLVRADRIAEEREKPAKSWRQRHISREPEETFVFEPEEEEEKIQTRPTVLLGTAAAKPEGILRYEGRGDCGDLSIAGDSFVIGSDPGCDGCVPSTTVSRKHARITRKDGIYFIEDLNSSNGTSVGGELLSYRTKMSLQKNEVVIFADEKFRFI